MNKREQEWKELFPEEQHQYISSLLEEERERVLDEVIDIVPSEKSMRVFAFYLHGEELVEYMKRKGYNDCRAEIKDQINNLKQ